MATDMLKQYALPYSLCRQVCMESGENTHSLGPHDFASCKVLTQPRHFLDLHASMLEMDQRVPPSHLYPLSRL
jgi:hypothetical protein